MLVKLLAKAETVKERQEINRELTKIYRHAAYYAEHKDQFRNAKRAWIARNPEKWREISRRNMQTYLARKRGQNEG
jgi:hypothetical protein